MRAIVAPSLVLHMTAEGVTVERDASRRHDIMATSSHLVILEALVHRPDLEAAFALLRAGNFDRAAQMFFASEIGADFIDAPEASIHFDQNQLWGVWGGQSFELTPMSRKHFGILAAMAHKKCAGHETSGGIRKSRYQKLVTCMKTEGLVTAPVGEINLGDLRRLFSVDACFGWNRGAPVDRYYLDRFIKRLQPVVGGDCLEVGAKKGINLSHGFSAQSYQTVDITPGEADLVGDVATPDLFADETWDTIIAFHVLEHCADPRKVVENFYRWLKPGALIAVQVPAVQRLHRGPLDCVRLMPDGMRHLFRDFSCLEVTTDENPLTDVAGIMGLSWQELTASELDFVHAEYPLVTNAVARK